MGNLDFYTFFREDDKALIRQKESELVTSKEFFEDAAEKNRETFKYKQLKKYWFS